MRVPLLILAASLALSACKNNAVQDNTSNVDENLTAQNIVSNDVTAIDAVTGDAGQHGRRRRHELWRPATTNGAVQPSSRADHDQAGHPDDLRAQEGSNAREPEHDQPDGDANSE